jgi:hypothetical protein
MTTRTKRPDLVLIYRRTFSPNRWVWRLMNSRKDVLTGSDDDFESFVKAKRNLERITGAKCRMKKVGDRWLNQELYKGFLQREGGPR